MLVFLLQPNQAPLAMHDFFLLTTAAVEAKIARGWSIFFRFMSLYFNCTSNFFMSGINLDKAAKTFKEPGKSEEMMSV